MTQRVEKLLAGRQYDQNRVGKVKVLLVGRKKEISKICVSESGQVQQIYNVAR